MFKRTPKTDPRADWVRSQSTQRSGRVPMNSNACQASKAPGKITAALRAGCLGCLFLRRAGLLAQEAQQFSVDFFRVCPRDAVWTVFHDQQPRPFDELGGAQ